MTVTLYNNKSGSNVLNKSYEVVQSGITATARGAVDVDRPALLLNYNSVNFNYFYISEFGRFYNISSRSLLPGGHILLSGESDPLESFASSVGNLEVLVTRAEDLSMREPDIADERIPLANDVVYDMTAGDVIMASENYVIGVC